ncbi:MAG TPA: CHASE2 domain-containing protein, partial [Myxococcota bacterium]
MGPSPNFFARFARFVPTLVVVGLAICFQVSGFGLSLDRRVQDAFTRVVPSHVPSPTRGLPDTAVVAIDPRSLRAIEGWPWPRDLYADAIENLAAAGARAIVFDIDFSSPSTPERDARLAESLRANGHVVLATFSQFQTLSGGAEMEIINRPIPILEEAAAALGSVLVPVDPDGVVRE